MSDAYKHRDKYHKKHYKTDGDEGVREVEKYLIEKCEQSKEDWGTINKYELARKLKCHKEYFNSLIGKRIHG